MSEYPPVIEHSEYPRPGWVKIHRQDESAPQGEFPTIRVLLGGPLVTTYNLSIDLFKKPPREYPPRHVGQHGAGVSLTLVEARALRNALTEWIRHQPSEDLVEFPEHEKMAAIKDEADVIAAFLEWLECRNIELIECGAASQRDVVVAFRGIEEALAAYFEIDLDVLELEKRQMLGAMRAQNDGYDPKHQYQPDEIIPRVSEAG